MFYLYQGTSLGVMERESAGADVQMSVVSYVSRDYMEVWCVACATYTSKLE